VITAGRQVSCRSTEYDVITDPARLQQVDLAVLEGR
jgi:hypothetical protein